ncbi:hypothetical protein CFIMG_007102RA [Ceratocystis fimbriata CBS 114723]|uniref:Uncharacterized protein n=1 Tax=Ceratocystis fimbriata CBS 114723 TaxID=1035309 RepID=A0A2C5WT07_9PEZI|nr:hypothetical protein CFIMG_007102RA [Ceratocystis fimbriata CBS 114723]
MKTSPVAFIALLGSVTAYPYDRRSIIGREVPQEHSHNIFLDIVRTSLNLNNPLGIADPVFGLLGNAAAKEGVKATVNLDCLKQLTADQAFTNAKAIGDVRGMAGALMYQAIERNTAGVGTKSAPCNETAVNPEIGALSSHQDPASPDAAATNKVITLELAKQLALIGVDPLLALESGTFTPGDLSDTTGKGNTCDTLDDEPGCIFSQRLLVLDASPDEVNAAVANIQPTFTGTGSISATDVSFDGLPVASNGNDGSNAVADIRATGQATSTPTPTPTPTSTPKSSTSANPSTGGGGGGGNATPDTETESSSSTASGTNIQTFTGSLGGLPPPVIQTSGDRPFSVNGNTFTGANAALGRSCDIQHNACSRAANSGTLSGGQSQCETQNTDCRAAITRRAIRRALKPIPRTSSTMSVRAAANGQFGTCSDPTIVFGIPKDRSQNAFSPSNEADFNHGSALNIGVIAGFICQRLQDSCKADATVVASCAQASTAAVSSPQGQSAADAFNNIITGTVSSLAASDSKANDNPDDAGCSVTATATSSATPAPSVPTN